jgi:hypothetical protein
MERDDRTNMDETPLTLCYWIVPSDNPSSGHTISPRLMSEAEARRLYGPAAEPLKRFDSSGQPQGEIRARP